MAANRRNHYRLLHVQYDAPAEVIKASYRALMSLHHPDKGGEAAEAVMLNQAYSVLSDAARRTQYDAQRKARATRPSVRGERVTSAEQRAPARQTSLRACPLCQLSSPTIIRQNTRCSRCRAPLAPVRLPGDPLAPNERRGLPRVSKSDWALLHQGWPSEVIDVRMRDLSPIGISIYCGTELPLNCAVRVIGAAFDVVTDVVSCRRVGKVFVMHGRVLTALLGNPVGGFVSKSA